MPINRQLNLLFIHIPKTAGTSVSEGLGFKRGIEMCYYYDKTRKVYPVSLHHMTPRQLVRYKLLTKKELFDYFCFTFVRNPFDRFVSEFHYRHPHVVLDREGEMLFDAFVQKAKKICSKKKWLIFDNHLRPQSDFFSYWGKNVVDCLLKFELLETEIEKLAHAYQAATGTELSFSQISHHKKSNRAPYQDYFNPRNRKIIEKLYRRDLKKFDYSFDDRF